MIDETDTGTETDAAPAGAPEGPVPEGLTVSRASLEDWHQVAGWAADEGWNPGADDVRHFHPADPAGFFVGRIDGRIVSAVSIVAYSDRYAFLGFYLVHPEHRGKGLGLATWRAAYPYAGDRLVGLDAVPAQEGTYGRSGFTAAYRTLRYAGRPSAPSTPTTAEGDAPGGAAEGTAPAATVAPVADADLDAITAYDRHCFPADRSSFLRGWLTGSGHTAYVCRRAGAVVGYGVLRRAQDGQRLGPLFADTPADAEALFDALASRLLPDEEVFVDVPETHGDALALVERRGLALHSHTVRMYAGPGPLPSTERTYGITSLELG